MRKWYRLGALAGALATLAIVAPQLRGEEPCEGSCEEEAEGCTYSAFNYLCESGLCWYFPCGNFFCATLGKEGTKVRTKTCNGVNTEQWYNAPCGTCPLGS
jgi:hypothetical protein